MSNGRSLFRRAAEVAGDAAIDVLEREVGERTANVDQLRIRVSKNGRFFGFGQKVVVPPDQIHIVSGDGIHSLFASKKTTVFGQAANASSIYWVNNLTVITPMSTLTFMVPVRGPQDAGFEVLDSNNVKYTVTAHVVARLDEQNVQLAAVRVGQDINGLVTNIQEIAEAELHDAAATMTLEQVIKNRQLLAQTARQSVNETLQELGYSLVLLKIGELGGIAYTKLVEQAEAIVQRDSTIAINTAQLATDQSTNERLRTEAFVNAETRRTTEAQKLAATRDVDRAGLDVQEDLAIRRHELSIIEQQRAQALAAAQHTVKLDQVNLDRTASLAQTEAEAEVALREQQLQQQRELDATTAEAARLAEEQARQLERKAQLASKEAAIKLQQEQDEANRTRIVETTQAQAQADALQIATDAETQATLKRATAAAQAAVQEADAAQRRAAAKRAEEAAAGLALADVEAREVEIESNRVTVKREEGLAVAAIAKEQADAEIHRAQGLLDVELTRAREQAALFAEHPQLVEIELEKMRLAHQTEIARLHTAAMVEAITAMAPNIRFYLYGDGGQFHGFVNQMMSLGHGISTFSEVPVLGQFVNGNGHSSGLSNVLGAMVPYIRQVLATMNPRVISTLTVGQLLEQLTPVVRGESTLAAALESVRNNAQFKLLADVPVAPLLNTIGVATSEESVVVAENK